MAAGVATGVGRWGGAVGVGSGRLGGSVGVGATVFRVGEGGASTGPAVASAGLGAGAGFSTGCRPATVGAVGVVVGCAGRGCPRITASNVASGVGWGRLATLSVAAREPPPQPVANRAANPIVTNRCQQA